jgi:hypothetical protein
MKIALMTDTHLAQSGRVVLANCDAMRQWVAAAQADITCIWAI